MAINESVISQPGLGNNEVYSRILSNAKLFWDFTALAWVLAETSHCRVFMGEIPIDDDNSGYSCTLSPPLGGPWALEILRLSNGDKLGNDIVWSSGSGGDGSNSTIPGGDITPPSAGSGTTATLTVMDLIKAQLRVIGVIESGETPDTDMITDMIQGNNIMLDSWSAQRLMVRALTYQSFPLHSGVSAYNIGIGQTWNTAKPSAISLAYVRDGAGIDYELEIYTENQYDSRSDKSFAPGRPEALWYTPGAAQQVNQCGTIFVYPIPDDDYSMIIGSQKPLTELVNATDRLIIEPAYFRALKWNGAVEMYHEYRSHNTSIPASYIKAARDSLSVIKQMNSSQLIAGTDLPGARRSSFDFLSGGVN